MKIALDTAAVADSLYADSALGVLVRSAPGGYAARVLTPENGDALGRIVADAFAVAAVRLGWAMTGELSVESPDDVPRYAAQSALVAATAMIARSIIYAVCGDGRSQQSLAMAWDVLDRLAALRAAPILMTPYRW